MKLNNKKFLLFSLSLLIIGSLYYLLFRQPIIASSYLGTESLHFKLFDSTLNYLPTFVHQLAFILLTWLALDRRYLWFSILFWLIVNSLFELGQLLKPDILSSPHILKSYFQNGTYSHGDMIAIFFATLLAYIIINNQKEN